MSDGAPVSKEKQATPKEIKDYQDTVGSLILAMLGTRPDIAFATSMDSRWAQNPDQSYIKAVKDLLRYLSGSRIRGITYGGWRFENYWLFKRRRLEDYWLSRCRLGGRLGSEKNQLLDTYS